MPQTGTRTIKAAAGLSTLAEPLEAVRQLCDQIETTSPDVAVVFISHQQVEDAPAILEELCRCLDARNVVGCTGGGIIGPNREVEEGPALALWTASLPGVRILPVIVDQEDLSSLTEPGDWQERIGVAAEQQTAFMLLPDPFSLEVDRCIAGIEAAYPGCGIVGGMASGGRAPGENRLFFNDQVLRRGMVGLSFSGPISVSSVVSQGCRPVGTTHVITKAHKNIIEELGGKWALDVLRETHRNAAPADQARMEHGIHIGRVVDEHLREFGMGDFLIRNLMGVVGDKALAVSDYVRPGQTIQFHLRDEVTASEDMRTLLSRKREETPTAPIGGLLFCCNGRGSRLFGKPNHDIGLVNEVFGSCPVSGFFAQGEIGPVGRRTFIHGFTSCLMLFHEP